MEMYKRNYQPDRDLIKSVNQSFIDKMSYEIYGDWKPTESDHLTNLSRLKEKDPYYESISIESVLQRV